MSSSGYYMTFNALDSTRGFGLMVRKLEGNKWKYAIWIGYNNWCDIDGRYCGLDESWFDSTTEIGYGLQLLDKDTYTGEILSFVKCSYIIINTNE